MNHNIYVLKYLKKTNPNEDYSKLEEYIKSYIQIEKYMNILQIKYNDIKNYTINLIINELTNVTLDVVFTYNKIFEVTHEMKCNFKTQYDEIDNFIIKNSIEFEKKIKEYHDISGKDYNDFYLKQKYYHETIDELLEKLNIKSDFKLNKSYQNI